MSFFLRVLEGLKCTEMLLFLKNPPELLSEPCNIWNDNVVLFLADSSPSLLGFLEG